MFTLSHTNGIACGDTASGELPRLRITVQDGEVASVYNTDEEDVEYHPQGLDYVGTIDHLFEWVLSELEKGPQGSPERGAVTYLTAKIIIADACFIHAVLF